MRGYKIILALALLLIIVTLFFSIEPGYPSKHLTPNSFSFSTGNTSGDLEITIKPVGREFSEKEMAAVTMFAQTLKGCRKVDGPNDVYVQNLLYGLAIVAIENLLMLEEPEIIPPPQKQNPPKSLPKQKGKRYNTIAAPAAF